MDMTRREFLGSSVGAINLLGQPLAPSRPPLQKQARWAVRPVRNECSLPESTKGYCDTLPWTQVGWQRPSLLILPAVLSIPLAIMPHIGDSLRHGATVIVESGAGFAGHLNFRQHRRSLREYLRLDVQAPVDLWSGGVRVPYIDYSWPCAVKVRDFSRVVPVSDQDGEIIAWAGDRPVGLKRQVERGTLIYLGSPLGPALWTGDAEARRWLSHFFSL